jgi:DNA replication protein DnaC
MNNQATLEKITQMRLWGIKDAFTVFLDNPTAMSADELIAHLVDAEWQDRHNRRIERLMHTARFRYQANLNEIDYLASRGLDKNALMRLADCSFIKARENIILTGPTGVGKSFIASALGCQACMLGYKTLYYNAQKLFASLKAGLADGSYTKLICKIEKHQLLIPDDFGLQPLDSHNRQALLEIIEDRHGKQSTIIASQFPTGKWHAIIGESAVADAILDRLVHNSHRVELSGESMRKRKNRKNDE